MHLRTSILTTVSLSALLLAAAATSYAAGPAPRTVQSFDTGWKFLQSDAPGADKPDFKDASWKPVTLPHDWGITGPVSEDAPTRGAGGFFPSGVGWYRKAFTVPPADTAPNSTRRVFIAFDGVMANSDVYLNGELLGHRPYGYVSFVYELTPHLKSGNNVLAVRVDDSQQPASRWYPGAGINRHVRLVTTNDAHIVPWGTFVTTPEVSTTSATIHVRSTVTNESATPVALKLQVRVVAPNGATVKTFESSTADATSIAPGATADISTETTIPNPDRWDMNHPALYTVHATVLRTAMSGGPAMSGRPALSGGPATPVDDEDVPFGVREFHFDPNQGFFLNGVHHKIYGAAMHTDGGAVGTAVPLAVWQRRLTELRKLGVNAIRTSHNPPAPEFLDLCDRMGFLVMDEMFDAWTVGKNTYDYHVFFKEWNVRDTTDSVMRDRNHPSIILWSAGNEIHDTPHPEIAIPILRTLVETFHKNDPTRPVTQALFRPNVSHDYENGLADLLDVIGQNYREQEILKAHADKPTRKIVGTENTHDRNQWVAMRDHPEYSGQFLWAGVDYLGEAGRWPNIGSGSGLLLSDALPRPRAFDRASWWSTAPMVRMARRVQVQRQGPIDPGYASATATSQAAEPALPRTPGVRPPQAPLDPTVRFAQPLMADWTPNNTAPHEETVEVYTNAQEVELFLNDTSLGVQKLHPDASPIVYKVPFTPGTLKAIARTGGKEIATDVLKTAGKPAHIELRADKPDVPLTPDWNDVRYIIATLVDGAGTRIPDSTTEVTFATSNSAQLVGLDNGNMTDHEPFQAPERRLYDGNVTAIVRGAATSGRATITATAPGVPPASISLPEAPLTKEDPLLAPWHTGERSF
jgi:beta-galactosidase